MCCTTQSDTPTGPKSESHDGFLVTTPLRTDSSDRIAEGDLSPEYLAKALHELFASWTSLEGSSSNKTDSRMQRKQRLNEALRVLEIEAR